MDWVAELKNLTEGQQQAIRECALKFRVPLVAAYLRAKSLGLLSPTPSEDQKRDAP